MTDKFTMTFDHPDGLTFAAINIPCNIVINGFSMKEVILDVLRGYEEKGLLNDIHIGALAEHIQNEFKIKLRLIQGLMP